MREPDSTDVIWHPTPVLPFVPAEMQKWDPVEKCWVIDLWGSLEATAVE